VQSWNDTQIVALVAPGSASGKAQVLQNGVWSNEVPFEVPALRVTAVTPGAAAPGAAVGVTGSGFGAEQGGGVVWLGSRAGVVVSWSETEIVAQVAAGAVTGVAKVEQNGVWSNAKTFVVEGGSGAAATLEPNVMTLVVGETRAIQALNAAGQGVLGLTWTSSDPNVVGLTLEDPPTLVAVAAGRATIEAGGASADVTVLAVEDLPNGELPVGTVLWSNPADSWGGIVPAVPSPEGVADVFAFSGDGTTVTAITSDGLTAWTADVGYSVLADFQGGLMFLEDAGQGGSSIVKLDGKTGQRVFTFTPSQGSVVQGAGPGIAVHPDGTIFAVTRACDGACQSWVIGVDSSSGGQKFSVPLPVSSVGEDSWHEGRNIVAGDGYYYVPCSTRENVGGSQLNHYVLVRVNSEGAADTIPVLDWTSGVSDLTPAFGASMITNADQGVFLTFWGEPGVPYAALTSGTGISVFGVSQDLGYTVPVLQAEDGSYVGYSWGANQDLYMIAFDQGGGVRWTVPNEWPWIATAGGGVIGHSGTIYDASGAAVGQMGSMPVYSWKGAYESGTVHYVIPALDLATFIAHSYWATNGANLAGNGFSLASKTFGLVFCGPEGDGTCVTPSGEVGTPIKFSYLPLLNLNDETYSQAVDFSAAYPSWVATIKSEAYSQFRKAFERLPVLVNGDESYSFEPPLPITALRFDRTNYVT
jgi:hypothetical protein